MCSTSVRTSACTRSLAAERVGPRGKVYAFEPDSTNFALLCANIRLNGYEDRVVAIRKAVSRATGVGRLAVHPNHHGWHALVGEDVVPDTARTGITHVEVVTVDGVAQAEHVSVDVLKVDVQGAESFVLEGASSVLSQPGVSVFVEWPGVSERSAALELLEGLRFIGFRAWVIDGRSGTLNEFGEDAACAVLGTEDAYVNLMLEKGGSAEARVMESNKDLR